MHHYTMKVDNKGEGERIFATHPATPRTFIVYAHKDGRHSKVDVVLWGVLDDGTPVPITMGGVWDGTSNANMFVLHPSGLCSTYDQTWDDFEAAALEMAARES